MRIKRNQRGYTAFLTDNEYGVLLRMQEQFNIDSAWPKMPTGERRSWSRRIRNGAFVRLDKDTRTW